MSTISSVRAVSGNTPYIVNLSDDLGNQWLSDEPSELGGGNKAASPERLLLGSLGACTAITLQMYAAHKQWPLTGVEVQLQFNPSGKPADGTDITRRISLQGELTNQQRLRLLEIANACPIHKVLTGEIRIASSLTTA